MNVELRNRYNLSESVASHIRDDEIEEETSFVFSTGLIKKMKARLTTMYDNIDKDVDLIITTALDTVDIIDDYMFSNNFSLINVSNLKEFKDYNYNHGINTAILTYLIMKDLGFPDTAVKSATVAALLSDLGRIKVDKDVMNKSKRLTSEEFLRVKAYPKYSYDLIKDSDKLDDDIKSAVLRHKECIDGSGYPNGLTGKDIPTMATVINLADTFDALVSDRPYRFALSSSDAFNILFTVFNKFDAIVLRALLNVVVVYPNGSVVATNFGDCCIVLRQNEGYPLRPVIKDLHSDEVIDLTSDYSNSTIITEFVR